MRSVSAQTTVAVSSHGIVWLRNGAAKGWVKLGEMKSYVSSHFRSKEGSKMERGEHDDHAAPEVAGPSKGVAVQGFKVASIYDVRREVTK